MAGFPLWMAVNVSSRQIQMEGLDELLVQVLQDTGLEPAALELEITESTLIQSEEIAVRVLERLKRVGVQISLDDFGTGFSSLSYLKRFPVDALKIDCSFVRGVVVDPDDAAIVVAILSMANALGLGVVAEGVETEQQRDFLIAGGCSEMQGYLFSRPVPAHEFLELLKRGSLNPKSKQTEPTQ